MTALTVNLNPIIELTDEQFYQLCQVNRELRFERTATGELIIMPPAGGETGNRNAGLTAQLWIWNEQNQLGKVFDSSTGFKLPNGADRSPDASWVKQERWDTLTQEQKERFIPLCPDFGIELPVWIARKKAFHQTYLRTSGTQNSTIVNILLSHNLVQNWWNC